MNFLKPIKFKNFETKNNIFLGPMAGITSYPFRKICLENGCGMVITEMISAQSLARANLKTLAIAKIREDHPVCEQIFGSDELTMKEAAKITQELGADMIEINASCPVKKITKTGAGVALMKTPNLLLNIIEKISSSIKIPLSVKIRTGFIPGDEIAISLAPLIEKAGAAMLHIHLRAASQIHSGPVDYKIAQNIKNKIKIPLIVNGSITDPISAFNMFKNTMADGISIARGSIANPLIFSQIEQYLTNGSYQESDEEKRKELFIRFLELNCKEKGEGKGLITARKYVGFWFKKFRKASYLRTEFMKIKTLKEARELLYNS